MNKIKHKILVLSGKGGVGKSTVASQLAIELAKNGRKVGLLDIDLCGPSLPTMLGVESHKVHHGSQGWIPVFVDADQRLCVMSIGFLLNDKSTAVVWRGPKKTATIIQFLEEVAWGELDYLVIDTPPGTSDEHISVCEFLNNSNPDGAIIVTTPQGVALSDVRKEISFCKKIEMPILGLVENMSGFMCPNCSSCYNIFSTGGGKALADRSEIPFIGRIPIDPKLGACLEVGQGFSLQYPTSPTLSSLQLWAQNTIAVHFPDDNSNSDSQ